MSNKGSMVAAVAIDNIVQVWFQSPTGDETDSCIFGLPCHDVVQAEHVAAALRADIEALRKLRNGPHGLWQFNADYNELSRQDAGERSEVVPIDVDQSQLHLVDRYRADIEAGLV